MAGNQNPHSPHRDRTWPEVGGRHFNLELPPQTRVRLDFQMAAAQIQSDSSSLVVAASALFKRLYETPEWTQEDADAAETWIEQGKRLHQEWDELDPPEELRPIWKDMSQQLMGLNRLFAEIPSLGEASKKDTARSVLKIQSAFNLHLSEMNKTETRLLKQEMELRGR